MFRDLIQGMRALRKGQDDHPQGQFRDSRQVVRMRCRYDVEVQLGQGVGCRGRMFDIGLGGMKIRLSPQSPPVGQLVSVSYLGPEAKTPYASVPCRVEWVRSRERDGATFLGLTYETSNELLGQSWVKVLLKELGFRPEETFQRRRFLRAECFVPVQAADRTGARFEGRLCNLGVEGALVEGPFPFARGSEVQLQIGPFEGLKSFQATGSVAQQMGQEQQQLLGLRFEDLSREAIDSLGQYLRHLLLNHWEV